MNILPTNTNPLSRKERYNGRASNIFPHAKHALESVPSMADEATKLNFTTGVVTQMNYIKKHEGLLAERDHTYGGLIGEVNSEGDWWVRQLEAGPEDEIYDMNEDGVVLAKGGVVTTDHEVAGVTWGDIHESEMEPWVREACWGEGGMLDHLKPANQYMHDLFSMRTRGHHDMGNFHEMFYKFVHGQESVLEELETCSQFVHFADRDWCKMWVVRSNHDSHLERWLNEADFRKDPLNARLFLQLQDGLLESIENKEPEFNVLEYALKNKVSEPVPQTVTFWPDSKRLVLLKDWQGGIECALHGDKGANGVRGTTRNLAKMGRKVNKGHDHKTTIFQDVMSTGACCYGFRYMSGPNSISVSHIVTYLNASRTIVTMWNGDFCARSG